MARRSVYRWTHFCQIPAVTELAAVVRGSQRRTVRDLSLASDDPIVQDGGRVRAGHCGGAAPAQGRAEGPTAVVSDCGDWLRTGVKGEGGVRGTLSRTLQGREQTKAAKLHMAEQSQIAVIHWAVSVLRSYYFP